MAKGQGLIRTLVEWEAVLPVALGATLLLTSAAAYAECAWVLWRYATASQTGRAEWKIERASSRDSDCRTNLQTELEQAKRSAGGSVETVIKGDGYITTDKSGRPLVIVEYQCLPDTVDPRVPKAR